MIAAVDTNELLALRDDDESANESEAAIRRVERDGGVLITPIVSAERAADGQFETSATLDRSLVDLRIQLTGPSRKAMFRTGEQFQRYVARRPDGMQWP